MKSGPKKHCALSPIISVSQNQCHSLYNGLICTLKSAFQSCYSQPVWLTLINPVTCVTLVFFVHSIIVQDVFILNPFLGYWYLFYVHGSVDFIRYDLVPVEWTVIYKYIYSIYTYISLYLFVNFNYFYILIVLQNCNLVLEAVVLVDD